MPRGKSFGSNDNTMEFLKSNEFTNIISEIVKRETEMILKEVKELKQEVIILRESNIELINLLTNTKKINECREKDAEVFKSANNTNKKLENEEVNPKNGNYNKIKESSKDTIKNSNSTVSKWTTIKNREQKENNRSQGIVGKGNNKEGPLKAADKKITLYISRLQPNTTLEDITSFLKNDFPEVICENGQSKYPAHYSSFKITISDSNYNSIMNPDIWPKGIYINRFFRKRYNKPSN